MRVVGHLKSAVRRAPLGFALAALLGLPGCGDDGKIGRYPVNGSVSVDGKAAAGAVTFFCPVGGPPELQKLRPMGVTDTDGKFQLTSFEKGDGAPAGQYKVIIMWPKSGPPAQDGSVQMGPDRLQNRYMNLEKSQLTAEVKAGNNDLPPFDLKTK